MKLRSALLAALLVLLSAIPAKADNRLIVRSTLSLSALQQLLSLQGLCGLPLLQNCSVVNLGDPLGQLFSVTTPLDPSVVVNLLRLLPGIVDAELDQVLSLIGGLNLAPSPPPSGLMADRTPVPYYGTMVWNSYANQQAAQTVGVSAEQMQFKVYGSGIVADIDTGVDPNHPALAGVLLPGYDFTRNQPSGSELTDYTGPTPQPCQTTCAPANVNQSSVAILDQSSVAILDQNTQYAAFGHGTMVMGIIHLVAPTAKLLPLKAFSSNGTGNLSDIIRAIYYAAQNHANVINMSFDFTTASAELVSALSYASQSALICSAAAGNDGQKEIVYPAALQSVTMGVASTDNNDVRSSFSNYGDAIVWVAAPGEGIISTYPFSTYAAGWGTSFSAPFVAGTSALLLNEQAATNESQVAAAVAHAVPVGADMGNGRLDIVHALQTISPADFSLSSNPTTSTITAGQTATYAVTVSPTNGFNQPVTLTCDGFPMASTCVITPAMVTPDGLNPASVTVTVQTTARATVPPTAPRHSYPLSWDVLARLIWLVGWLVWLLVWASRGRLGGTISRRPDLGVAVGLLAVSFCFYSCNAITTVTSGPPTLSAVALNPTSVNGGSPSTGTVTLSGPAPSGGAVVALASSNTAVATLPANVTVPAGVASATFTVSTVAVTASTSVTVSATYSGATRTAMLTVTPLSSGPTLTSFTLNPTSVIGGSASTGSVTLNGVAPSGGAVVTLSRNNTAAATVPASVTIPVGASSATFTVTTLAVTASTSVTLSASYSGVTIPATLTVAPPSSGPTLTSFTLNPTGVTGGSASTGSVALSGPAPAGGAVVSLSSANTAAATVPASVTIPAGATSATFTVTTLAVTASTSVTLSASYSGITIPATLTVTPPSSGPTLTSFTLNPTSVTGGLPSMGSLTLNGAAPSGGAVVTLSSNSTAAATVPASVTIPAGASSATFTVTTLAVTASTTATLSASYSGVTLMAALTVAPPPDLNSLNLNPSSVNGGSPATGSVTLNGPAPSGGAAISLLSSNTTVATVPATVSIPAGSTTAAFGVTTLAVSTSTSVTISATYLGVTRTATLTVTPLSVGPTLTSITLNPTAVNGGSASTGSVALSGPAPAGGAMVSLTSSNTAATTPASVTIPAGATSAVFTVNTLAVTASTPVTLSASYAGVTHTALLTVNPTPPPGTPAGTYTLTITGTSGNLNHNIKVTLVVN